MLFTLRLEADDFIKGSSDEDELSGSDFETERAKKRRQKRAAFYEFEEPRRSGRSRTAGFTYNEDAGDDQMDLDDMDDIFYDAEERPQGW